MQVEEYLTRDDRVVLPVGSTEQHGYLSLETDNILAERVSAEAAEPLGVLVLPVLPYRPGQPLSGPPPPRAQRLPPGRPRAGAPDPLGVPVLPVLPYGLTPSFGAFPGSPTL